ncbi:MAG: sensor histidine kinase [Candidatus Latescibacterota bacterium]
MFDWQAGILDPEFLPAGQPYPWAPGAPWMPVLADGLVSAALALVLLCLIRIALRRSREAGVRRLVLLCAAFLGACSVAELLGALTAWAPAHRLAGTVGLVSAALSVATAAVLVRLTPRLVARPVRRPMGRAEGRGSQEELRAFSQQLIAGQEEERRRVARDLHDGVNQILSAIRCRAEVLLQQTGSPGVVEGTRRIVDLVDTAIDEVHRLSHGLRPTVLDDLGLASAARTLFDEFSLRTGLKVEANMVDLPPRLPGSVETAVYRILQEALQNVAAQAQALTVWVDLGCRGGSLSMVVVDDGGGMDLGPRSRLAPEAGLAGMQERALLAGGRLRVTRRPGSGTELRLQIPVAEEPSGQPAVA